MEGPSPGRSSVYFKEGMGFSNCRKVASRLIFVNRFLSCSFLPLAFVKANEYLKNQQINFFFFCLLCIKPGVGM